MTTMLDDVRLALRQICQSMGLPADAATAISLIVLGVALNVVALGAVQYAGIGRHAGHQHVALRSAAHTELKVMRTVVVSTLKKIGDSGRRLCLAEQWQMKGSQYHIEVGFAWAALGTGQGCDATIASSAAGKTAIAFVEC
jgi:hypothetical protein